MAPLPWSMILTQNYRKMWQKTSLKLSPWLLAISLLFVILISWMQWRQYAVFHLHAPDVATFAQAIWRTLQGDLLFSSIINRSILAYHFTPIFALFSPLLLLWEDVRVLFVAQTVFVALAGIVIAVYAKREIPAWALWIPLAFFLNAALHEVALNELRRITFAMPFIALALFSIAQRRYRHASLFFFGALLCKEDVGILLFGAGLCLLLWHREWKWGSAWIVAGLAWTGLITFCVIPSFQPNSASLSCSGNYPQLSYFSDFESGSPSEEFTGQYDTGSALSLVNSLVSNPADLLAHLFDREGRRALWRIFLPLGLLLPFIGGEWLIIAAPYLGLLLLSSNPQTHTLQDWYMAPLLPILFFATVDGIKRLDRNGFYLTRFRPIWVTSLLVMTLIGYRLYSYGPGGGKFIPIRYEIFPHHQTAAQILSEIPTDASIVSQDAFVNHLALREELYLFPIYNEERAVDFYLFDRQLRHYPLSDERLHTEIEARIADPSLTIVAEGEGTYLFGTNGVPNPSIPINAVAEESIHLERVEIAQADRYDIFRTFPLAAEGPLVDLTAGRPVRVTLYWEAMAKPVGERTVSVRLVGEDGRLIAQDDSQPSRGARPTSWWEPGWQFRDVYYLNVPDNLSNELGKSGHIELLLYDSYSQTRVPFGDEDVLRLALVNSR